jgi:Sulfotransferase family
MVMPNFLVIGAAKAGTTSLYAYLKQHPEIYLTPFKETKFFAYEGERVSYGGPRDAEMNGRLVNNLADYQALFAGANGHKAIGEVCPLYISVPKSLDRIKHHVPRAQLFCILRNPVERAYSAYLHLIRDGRETAPDFAEGLRRESQRVRDNYAPLWFYKGLGLYHAQLKPYFDVFSRDQLHVYLYDDFNAAPGRFIREMFQLLGVDDTFVPNMSRKWNISGVPRNAAVHRLLSGRNIVTGVLDRVPGGQWLRSRLRYRNLDKPPLAAEARTELIEAFRDDVVKLQDLLGRDLSAWLR